MKPEVAYLADDGMDEAGDQELRDLLTTCFTGPQDVVFKTQRYFREPYKHRWIIRNERGAVIAHAGVHEKGIEAKGRIFCIGGICEVCVHPDYRGRGFVKLMLESAHFRLSEHHFPFAVLFGNPEIYGSCGYVPVKNLYLNEDAKGWKTVNGMIRQMADLRWPDGDVHLVGLKF